MASAKVYFEETFTEGTDNWVVSDWKKDSGQAGKWVVDAGNWYGDEVAGKGMKTSQDARFYATSAVMAEEFDNEGKDLVLQFQVRHAQDLDCGGGYIKMFPAGLDQEKLDGDSEYNIMFGPDICGSTKRVHVIFNYKGENMLVKKSIECKTDMLSHTYTLVVHPDNTYAVLIDGEEAASGSMEDDWDFLAPKEIKDPDQSKPEDWVEDSMMDDPNDVKPADWDATPRMIPDPTAEKPEDWDDESDGDWEAPMKENPEWKGEWEPKRVENPAYQGPWVHPMIPNPEYSEDAELYHYKSGAVGFDLWQVKSGSIFDNIIVTDSVEEAAAFAEEHFPKEARVAEEAMFEEFAAELERQVEEEDARRAAAEAAEEAEEDDDDEDYEDEEEDDEDEPSHDEL